MNKENDIRIDAMEMIEDGIVRICNAYKLPDHPIAALIRLVRWANQLPAMTDEEVKNLIEDESD